MRGFFPILLVILGLAFLTTGRNVSPSSSSFNKSYAPGDLIWEDNFDTFNTNVWHHEINMNGGYNNEFQIYDDYGSNAYVKDGSLWIRPALSLDTVFGGNVEQLYNGYLSLDGCTDWGGETCARQASYPYIHPPTVSARLRTKGSFSFTYGRVEVRARIPTGDWMWPAIWMLPEEDKYGQWPRSGEIDIMESRGNKKLWAWNQEIGVEQAAATLHFGPSPDVNGHMNAHGSKNTAPGNGFDMAYHIFAVLWTPDMIQFSIDGDVIKTIAPSAQTGFWGVGGFPGNIPNPWVGAPNFKMAPFDQNFHFVLNVAVGGDYFPEGSTPIRPWGSQTAFLDFFDNRGRWWPTWDSEESAMAIDYIRVYAI
jgi:beta-glucanase (GH16 family)